MRDDQVSWRGCERTVSLLGAAPDTGNLGVNALFHSIVHGLHRVDPSLGVVAFDNRLGIGTGQLPSPSGPIDYRTVGIRRSRRVHRWEATWRYRLAAGLPSTRHPGVNEMHRSVGILDISAGDSFSDIYGRHRFESVMSPKTLSLKLGRPLVLLPQTYGPFSQVRSAERAAEVLRNAVQVWARDEHSFSVAVDLDPSLADDGRGRLGVDVAFALPAIKPEGFDLDTLFPSADGPLVGINVSGLLSSHDASERFELALDYPHLMTMLVERLLEEDCRVMLVPHVGVAGDTRESDRWACEQVVSKLPPRAADRAKIATGFATAPEAKWIISQCDWFCGARMHSTIASLSAQVPTVGIAYSDKLNGVFATCRAEDRVLDARSYDIQAAVQMLMSCFRSREGDHSRLADLIPDIIDRSQAQLSAVVREITCRETAE